MLTTRLVVSIFSAGMIMLGTGMVSGQDYPSKPIRIITGSAGGPQDFAARAVAQGLTGAWGQPVVVSNQASTMINVPTVSKSPPDGYTLLVAGETYWTGVLLQGNQPNPGDLSSISILSGETNALIVHPSLPVKSVKELIALAKARPKQLNFAAATLGSVQHLAGLLFNVRAGVDIVPVSYKGTGAAANGVISGEVQLGFLNLGSVSTYIKSGRLRALAVTGLQPSALMPGVPTVAASGMPGYDMTSALSFYAPPKTPVAIINQLNREAVRTLKKPEVKDRFLDLGSDVIASSPEELTDRIKYIITVMGKLIKDAGIHE